MGGRGGASTLRSQSTYTPQQRIPIPKAPNSIAQQAPDDNNTPVVNNALAVLAQMPDDQLAQLAKSSRTVDMPNHLNDVPDATQKFAYSAGINERPTVLDDADFDKYLKDNGIPRSSIISRSMNAITVQSGGITYSYTANDLTDMMKYSRLNYVGGKHGGQAHGAGTYFDRNGGANTGYGSQATAIAVLNPKTANVIDHGALSQKATAWARSHPKFVAQVGTISNHNLSVYALAMGYNVITSGTYTNVIDRKALVYRKSNL